MKVSLTEGQLRSFNNRIIYEGILDNMVFKISLIVEDGKTEPDMEWDFTNIKKDIDKSKLWVKTKEDAIQYIESVTDKIKNITPELRKKILKYVVYSFIGLLSIKQLNKTVEPVVKRANQIEKATDDYAKAGYPRDVEAILIVELDGTESEVNILIKKVEEIAKKNNSTIKIASTSLGYPAFA